MIIFVCFSFSVMHVYEHNLHLSFLLLAPQNKEKLLFFSSRNRAQYGS